MKSTGKVIIESYLDVLTEINNSLSARKLVLSMTEGVRGGKKGGQSPK